MKAKLLNRTVSNTFVVEIDYDLAMCLFVNPGNKPNTELTISAVITNAMTNAIQIGNLISLWRFLNESTEIKE
jgi:hypothetical protein